MDHRKSKLASNKTEVIKRESNLYVSLKNFAFSLKTLKFLNKGAPNCNVMLRYNTRWCNDRALRYTYSN